MLAARPARKRLPRWVWITTLVIAVASVAALAIAWWQDGDTISEHPLDAHKATSSGGLGVGIVLGIGVGVVIGSLLAARRRRD